ncbi:beta strand repeat-containing protein, partial [Megasphaera massiliensis]
EGGTAAGTGGNYAGSNLQITEKTETTGATTYDVKLADNITLGSAADSAAGTEGTDSSITVNGKDGSAVAINGADGSIALDTADGSPVTIKGGTAANDVNGKSIDRVTVGGATVATLDDGMVYTGDTGSAAVKLNKTVNIVGGETDSTKLSTDNNIGIVAEQDGDNGKLTVRLAKDITGLNTVTAGNAILGNQTTTTAGGASQTGSYVTGLGNTTWNVSDPDIVSGRAATEDQLKTVSDSLVDGTSENATGGFGLADGSGTTVKQDLGKTITVKGGVTDGTATTDNPDGVSNITTTVKDGALEVSLNKDLDLGSTGSITTGNTVINNDGVKVGDTALTTGGLTITNGPSVTTDGIDGGSKQITNVASGSDGTDAEGNKTYNTDTNAANIGDIKNITNTTVNNAKTELTNDGLNFTADSGDAVHRNLGETLNIAGDGNITTTSDATNGKITVGLSNTVAVGDKGSEDGSLTVNGADGSSVAINGSNGSITFNTGSGSPVNIAAGTQVNNLAGTPIDRITVGGATVATLDDGMKYGGDFGTVSNVKLNNQVNVKGEATTEANLTTGNIGVVSSQDGDNGLLVVKLNKDINLGEKGSVTTGNTVVNNSGLTITNGPSVTTGGIDAGGSKITNVATGTDGTDAVNVAQLEKRISDIAIGESKTTELTVEGGKAAPTDGTYAGNNLQVTASTTANGSPTYDVKLADNITLGSAADSESGTTGTDGSITLNGANGSSVAVNGANGSVTAKGTDGSAVAINGSDGSIVLNTGSVSPVTIQAGTSADNLAGTSVDRISVGGQTIATMSDGQKYAGDNAKEDGTNVIAKKLNEQLDVVGGADATRLTDNNIGVNNVNGQLKVQLAQNIDLGKDGSVTTGATVINNDGVTITPSTGNPVTLTGTGLNNGGNQITNVASGSDGVDADGNPTYNTT